MQFSSAMPAGWKFRKLSTQDHLPDGTGQSASSCSGGGALGDNSEGQVSEPIPRCYRCTFGVRTLTLSMYTTSPRCAVDGVQLQHVGDHSIGHFRFQHERFIDKHPPDVLRCGPFECDSSDPARK